MNRKAAVSKAYVRPMHGWWRRDPFFVRWPGLALVSYLMPILLAPLLWLYSLFAVYVSTPIYNRMGRVRPSSARDATRHGSRSAPAPR